MCHGQDTTKKPPLLHEPGVLDRRRHGEAEQGSQTEAAAALQGRPVCHPLGLYSSRDLPGIHKGCRSWNA